MTWTWQETLLAAGLLLTLLGFIGSMVRCFFSTVKEITQAYVPKDLCTQIEKRHQDKNDSLKDEIQCVKETLKDGFSQVNNRLDAFITRGAHDE
jgi:hypothetical protein